MIIVVLLLAYLLVKYYLSEMGSRIHHILFVLVIVFGTVVNAAESAMKESETKEDSNVVAAIMLAEAKIKKDAKQIKEIATKKGFDVGKFGAKLSAMMVTTFISKGNYKVANNIISGVQFGYINETYEEYVKIDYEKVTSLAMSEDEKKAMDKVEALMNEANKNIKYHDTAAPKKPTREYMESVDVETLPDEELTWFEYVQRHWKIFSLFAFTLACIALYYSRFSMATLTNR